MRGGWLLGKFLRFSTVSYFYPFTPSVRTPTFYLVHEFQPCSRLQTGVFSKKLLNAYKKMTLTLSKSGSSFKLNQMWSMILLQELFTNKWKEKEC